jgi:hypothetical protein
MTDKEFCKIDTEFYGEVVDNIKQIRLRSFDGKELKEYVEHCIKLNLLNISGVMPELLCVDGDVDGLTKGNKYNMIFSDRTHCKLIDDYGIESMYYRERFKVLPTQ